MKDKLAELAHATHIMTPEISELAKQIHEQEQALIAEFRETYPSENEEMIRYYLGEADWDVEAATRLYWRENILIY